MGYFKLKQSAIDARLKAEKVLHDPIIFKNWTTLSDESKKEFIDYLVGSVGMSDEQIQDKLKEFSTQIGTSGEE